MTDLLVDVIQEALETGTGGTDAECAAAAVRAYLITVLDAEDVRTRGPNQEWGPAPTVARLRATLLGADAQVSPFEPDPELIERRYRGYA